ncbi:MAG: SAM-dependent chlorinase/fluorinase [Deltaproteobacteria bacterium]|nr:SAM-dependent chlorinase/fluorinase [Deltaproteobacteria bacterium]
MPVITLSTDFGRDDPYVGIMKGVILGINPRATLVDITHGFSPDRLQEAAWKLSTIIDYFPKGTIHLAVVDPGVGGARRPITVKTKTHCWVGPDNGLFSQILRAEPRAQVFHLTNDRYFLKPVSATFHGRDIFAPVAAHLSRGLSLPALGKRISDPVLLDLPEPLFEKKALRGQVLYADRFGNLITNLSRELLEQYFPGKKITVRIGRRVIQGIQENYAQAEPGRLLALFGSSGFLEIACNLGSAAELLGYNPRKFSAVRLDNH